MPNLTDAYKRKVFDENEITTLKEICTIRTGFQGKKKEGNKYKFVNLSDIDEYGEIDFNKLVYFSENEISEKYVLKKDEIIFKKLTTAPILASILKEDTDILVPSGHFFILGVQKRFRFKILPKYITWFLNEETTQKKICDLAVGTSMMTIKKSDFEMLEVIMPSIETQLKIVATYELMMKEKQLTKELLENREKHVNAILRNML